MLVLDVSVAIAWCFEDQASGAMDDLLTQVARDGAIVPPIWMVEVSNVLIQAARRGRLAPDAVQKRLDALDMLPIETDVSGTGTGWRATVLALATAEGLSTYEATYLELAMRRALPLASGDAALRRAAARHGLTVLPVATGGTS